MLQVRKCQFIRVCQMANKLDHSCASFFVNSFWKRLRTLYVKLIVTHIGQTPKRKNVNATFLYQGKFAGIIGQLNPSPSNSLMPQILIDSFI